MVKLPRNWDASVIIVIILFAIGLVASLITNPLAFVLPVVILGGIFLLYKYPPSTWGGGRSSQPYVKQNRSKPQQRPKSRRVPFKVIDGGKDDDDLPKYH